MFCGLLFTGWLCKLCIRTLVEIVEIALPLKYPKHLSKYMGHPGSLEYHMMLAVLVAAVQGGRSQQSVLDAGWELLTTSPSTELVFETDFFWFLKMFAGLSFTNESTDCILFNSYLVNRSSSAAASDLTAALSVKKCSDCEIRRSILHNNFEVELKKTETDAK